MRLGLVVGLCVAIFGGVYLLMGRTPEDRLAVKPPREAALDRPPARRTQGVKAARHTTSSFGRYAPLFERLRASLVPRA